MKAILLAAGCSKRMGQPKQLLNWQGKSMIQHSIDKLNNAGFEVTTVLGANAEEIAHAISNSQIIVNSNWSEGMGTSIAFAVENLSLDCSSVLIAQSDQLALKIQDFELMKSLALKNPTQIICSNYYIGDDKQNGESSHQKIYGVPAIFPSDYFPELAKLNGNLGARKIILSNMKKVYPVQIQNASTNINTPEDWNSWRNSLA